MIHQPLGGASGAAVDIEIQVGIGGWGWGGMPCCKGALNWEAPLFMAWQSARWQPCRVA